MALPQLPSLALTKTQRDRNVPSGGLAVRNRGGNDLGVLGLLDGGEDQGGVGGGILGLVNGDGLEVSRVGDDGGELLELVEDGGHDSETRVKWES